MRPTLAKYLIESASSNSKLIFLTADLGFGVFDEFKDKFPDRYINVGIAEAGMITIAAGLAAEGFTPIVYSIASFLLPKTYEQVRLLSAYNENKIIIVGAGGGLSYSMSGPSHHSLDDLALALLIPNMNVFCPSGPDSLRKVLKMSSESENSSYIQIGKFGEPDYPRIKIVENSKLGLISCGVIANDAFKIHNELVQNNISADLIIIESLRPFNRTELAKFIKGKEMLVIIEESWEGLSLYSIVIEYLYQNKIDLKLIRIGPPHEILKDNVERNNWLLQFGLSYENLIDLMGSQQ
jgi:transketolase